MPKIPKSFKVSKEQQDRLHTETVEQGFPSEQDYIVFKLFGEDSARQTKKDLCKYLSVDGRLCGQGWKKTNSVKCELCIRMKKEDEEARAREMERYTGFRIPDPFTIIYNLKQQVSELSKPQQALLDRITQLEGMNNSLLRRLEEIAVLETDNERLRKENEELSQDKLVEKNSFLTIQIGKLGKTIEDLKAEVEKTEALADSRKERLDEIVKRFSQALKDFTQYCPTTADSYQMHDYISKMQRKCQDLEGYIATLIA